MHKGHETTHAKVSNHNDSWLSVMSRSKDPHDRVQTRNSHASILVKELRILHETVSARHGNRRMRRAHQTMRELREILVCVKCSCRASSTRPKACPSSLCTMAQKQHASGNRLSAFSRRVGAPAGGLNAPTKEHPGSCARRTLAQLS